MLLTSDPSWLQTQQKELFDPQRAPEKLRGLFSPEPSMMDQ